jgi:small-conductance mechanosensitive channel
MTDFHLNTNFSDHIVKGLNDLVPRLPAALFDLLLGILVIRLVGRGVRFALRITNVQPGLRDVLGSVIEIIMWVFLSITLLNELGFSGVIYFFTGSVAAIGIAMAAGGSTLIADIIAGIFLARDNDFNIGDEVIVGERPTLGVIESMDARRTRLRDENGILHVIPNSVVERKEWVLVHKRPETGALVMAAKAARRFTAVARQKRADAKNPPRRVRKNDQPR